MFEMKFPIITVIAAITPPLLFSPAKKKLRKIQTNQRLAAHFYLLHYAGA